MQENENENENANENNTGPDWTQLISSMMTIRTYRRADCPQTGPAEPELGTLRLTCCRAAEAIKIKGPRPQQLRQRVRVHELQIVCVDIERERERRTEKVR